MINLDIVKKCYRVVTCCYCVIHKLHNHSNDAVPRIPQHFTIHIGTMSIGKHSDAD